MVKPFPSNPSPATNPNSQGLDANVQTPEQAGLVPLADVMFDRQIQHVAGATEHAPESSQEVERLQALRRILGGEDQAVGADEPSDVASTIQAMLGILNHERGTIVAAQLMGDGLFQDTVQAVQRLLDQNSN